MNSCSMLFSMSKDRIFRPGSKESMFSKESISTMRSVLMSPGTSWPSSLMQDPMSVS